MKNFKVLILTSIIGCTSFAQGPVDGYGKGKGNLDIGLGYTSERGNKFFAGTIPIGVGSSRNITSYSLFGIYGITNRLDVQVNIPYLKLRGNREEGLQDGSLYLKYRAFSLSNKLGNIDFFPTLGFYQPLSNYSTVGSNAIGQQNQAIDTRLVVQQNITKGKLKGGFISLQAGHFFKSFPTPNAYSASIKAGYAFSKFYFDGWFEINEAFGGTDYLGKGDLAPNAATQGFKGLGYGFQRVGFTAYYGIINKLGAYAGYARTIKGRNALKANRFSFGIVFKPLN